MFYNSNIKSKFIYSSEAPYSSKIDFFFFITKTRLFKYTENFTTKKK